MLTHSHTHTLTHSHTHTHTLAHTHTLTHSHSHTHTHSHSQVTCTIASICGDQRTANPDHLWSEADKNENPEHPFAKSKVAAENKVCAPTTERVL